MDELNKRVCDVMEKFCNTKSEFASELGVGLPLITHITTGRNKPGVDILQKIVLTYPSVNATWLLTGNGKMINSQKEALNIDNELNNIMLLLQKLAECRTNTTQVISYHKLIIDELKYFNELDNLLLNNQNNLTEIQEKINKELTLLKSKVI